MSGPDGTAAEAVALAQYATPDRLSTRISIHDKYSVNRQGFSNWIAEHYSFAPGASVLELGCGTGAFWTGRDSLIRSCRRLILSDFSEGMLDAARKTLAGRPEIAFERIDIRQIPYPDRSFDAVIANMMLYHVPDIPGALREVRRVLREGGTFCCATYGEHGIMEYLCGLFPEEGAADSGNHAFPAERRGPAARLLLRRAPGGLSRCPGCHGPGGHGGLHRLPRRADGPAEPAQGADRLRPPRPYEGRGAHGPERIRAVPGPLNTDPKRHTV